jgi:branched-chain amino acid aminotransferase
LERYTVEGKFFINGREVDAGNALVSVFDLGFMYGATFMEAVRSFNHKPFRLAEHLDRMERSISAAGIQIPITRKQMEDFILQAFDSYLSEIEKDNDCWVCINITPGETFPHPLVAVGDRKPTIIVYAVPLPFAEYADFYTSGISAFISTVRNTSPQVLSPRIKVRSRMHYFMAKAEVKKIDHRAFPLLLDLSGNLSEGSGANIFLIIDGELHTPAVDNILEGISRKTVIELAEKMKLGVNERNIQLLDIRNADEAFFSTTSYCILPIKQIDREEPLTTPGPVTSNLLEEWSKAVGMDIVAQAEKYRNKTSH